MIVGHPHNLQEELFSNRKMKSSKKGSEDDDVGMSQNLGTLVYPK